jgi:hypothetical protein
MDIYRDMIIPTDQVVLAREIAVTLDPAHNANMWITPLSPTGQEPATHFISSGLIPEEFASMVPCVFWAWDQPDPDQPGQWVVTDVYPGDPITVYEACIAQGMTVTQEEIDDLFAAADVSDQEPFVAMSRMGVQMVQESID